MCLCPVVVVVVVLVVAVVLGREERRDEPQHRERSTVAVLAALHKRRDGWNAREFAQQSAVSRLSKTNSRPDSQRAGGRQAAGVAISGAGADLGNRVVVAGMARPGRGWAGCAARERVLVECAR